MTMTVGKIRMKNLLNAIHFLRNRFAAPIRIEELASIAQMSPSAFHRQFRAVTFLTPLQYQKQLRLLEARRGIFAVESNVGTTAAWEATRARLNLAENMPACSECLLDGTYLPSETPFPDYGEA